MKTFALVAVAFSLGMIAGAWMVGAASADHLSNCDGPGFDHQQNGTINAADLGCVAAHYGPIGTPTPEATWTPASSATSTATVTLPSLTATSSAQPTEPPVPSATIPPTIGLPSPSNTPIPTATNTPTGYTPANLLDDTTGLHDGTLCTGSPPGGVSGFDWQFGGVIHGVTSSHPGMTSWGTVQWVSCGASTPNTILEIRNLRVYALTDTGWRLYPAQNNPMNWCGDHRPDTTAYVRACINTANGWIMPTGAMSLHWAESTDPVYAGDVCHLVLYEMRAFGGAVMANSGLDWRVGGSTAGGSWFGAYKRLTSEWQWIGGTSCNSAQLSAAPPPLP